MQEVIEAESKGTKIIGFIYFWHSREIGVEMIEPFKGLRNSRHIPLLGGNPGKDYIGENGKKKAKELLVELYIEREKSF